VRRYPFWILALSATWLTLGTGCTEAFVRRSTRGATQGALAAKARHLDESETGVAGGIAKRATAGVAEALTAEERREAFTQLSRDLAGAAAAGMKAELAEAIGPNGDGPLADRLAGTIERVSQSAIFPDCTGPDRAACVRAQVQALSHSSATGFAQALRKELGLPALIVAFAAGVLSTLAALSLWVTLRGRRPSLHPGARAATT
jgi:hypothetical protein